ncbi:MAG: transcription termination factor NusA [Candidatus Aquicultorales bacterium]
MNGELIEALRQLEREKQIDPATIIDALEQALVSAYKRNYEEKEVRVVVDGQTGQIRVFEQEVEEVDGEKRVIEEKEVTPSNFGRIAAQTAKQVILQRIREAERDKLFEEYVDREGDIVTGIVEQSDHRYTLVNLGRVEALLPPQEQVPGERYDHGRRIKCYIVEVRKTTKEPSIVVSRSHPGLLRRLFELEVPEIYEGYVEIKAVAREPGHRSKIAVASRDESIDPVGACVGPRGSRVRMVVDELKGEKIDVVQWSDDPATLVANALSPAKVKEVLINEEDHTAEVIVPDHQLSLAIGKEGQNARLAAKLTGWRIDIKSETQASEEEEAENILGTGFRHDEEGTEVTPGDSVSEGFLAGETAGEAVVDTQCAAIKANGERCLNRAKPGSAYCGVHHKLEKEA